MKSLYVIYDVGEVNTVCATTSMNKAVIRAFEYAREKKYTVTDFSPLKGYVILEYTQSFRVGGKKSTIVITDTEIES